MELQGDQYARLLDALMRAFDKHSDVEMLFRLRLNRRLPEAAPVGDLRVVWFGVIQRAEREGWLPDLIKGACKENPGNQHLKAVAGELLGTAPLQRGCASGRVEANPPSPLR